MPNNIMNFAPDDFVQGGLLNDVDVEITDARFVAWDYDGNLPSAEALAVRLTMVLCDDEDRKEHIEYLSAGKVADFLPNPEDDGLTLISQGTASSLRKGSNLELFSRSLVEAGFDASHMGGQSGIGYLKGCRFHIIRKPAPKRTGLPSGGRRREGEEDREKTYLAVDRIISTPWDKGKSSSRAAVKPAATAAKPAAAAMQNGDAETEEKAQMIFSEVLAEAGAPLKFALLRTGVFKRCAKEPAGVKNTLAKLASDAAWLEANGFTVDAAEGTVTI